MKPFDQTDQHKVAKGILLFNAQKYWECHEELEHHWLEEPGDIRNVYWAIIQVAAALIHYREGNLIGAINLIEKAKRKFEKGEQTHIESEWLERNLSWSQLKMMVREISPESSLVDFKKLFDFRFKDPSLWQ